MTYRGHDRSWFAFPQALLLRRERLLRWTGHHRSTRGDHRAFVFGPFPCLHLHALPRAERMGLLN